jgi:hypothetical protein
MLSVFGASLVTILRLILQDKPTASIFKLKMLLQCLGRACCCDLQSALTARIIGVDHQANC